MAFNDLEKKKIKKKIMFSTLYCIYDGLLWNAFEIAIQHTSLYLSLSIYIF